MEAILKSSLFESILSLILIYALLSLLVSTITEIINKFYQERGKMLHETLTSFFNDSINVNFGHLLYNHPMIDNIKKNRFSLPQYISAEMFSTALIDVVSNYARSYSYSEDEKAIIEKDSIPDIFARFKAGILKMEHTDLKLMFLNMLDKSEYSENKLECLRKELEKWFSDQMQRTSGWYKNKMSSRLRWVGLFVALALNIDSIHLFQTLMRTPQLRTNLVAISTEVAANYESLKKDSTITDLKRAYSAVEMSKLLTDSLNNDSLYTLKLKKALTKIDSVNKIIDTAQQTLLYKAAGQIDQLNSLGIPLGWRRTAAPLTWFKKDLLVNNPATGYFLYHQQGTVANIILYILGILISMFSLSVGAPFWFDLLLKFVNLRKAGARPLDKK